jgi:hypothetical protein
MVGTSRCDVRAAFSGARRAFDDPGPQRFRPLNAAGDAAARHPYPFLRMRKAGTSRCDVRAAFSGAKKTFRPRGWQAFRPLDAAGDIAARCPYLASVAFSSPVQ